MTLTSFSDLLQAATQQSTPQRLLFVFTAAGVPDDATPEQRARHGAGQGGTLTPLICVDKVPAALSGFEALRDEAQAAGAPPWDIVFVAALSGHADQPPADAAVDAALQRMVDAIKQGQLHSFMPFDRQGQLIRFR